MNEHLSWFGTMSKHLSQWPESSFARSRRRRSHEYGCEIYLQLCPQGQSSPRHISGCLLVGFHCSQNLLSVSLTQSLTHSSWMFSALVYKMRPEQPIHSQFTSIVFVSLYRVIRLLTDVTVSQRDRAQVFPRAFVSPAA